MKQLSRGEVETFSSLTPRYDDVFDMDSILRSVKLIYSKKKDTLAGPTGERKKVDKLEEKKSHLECSCLDTTNHWSTCNFSENPITMKIHLDTCVSQGALCVTTDQK